MTTSGPGVQTDATPLPEPDLQLVRQVMQQPLEAAVQVVVTLSDEDLLALEGTELREQRRMPWAAEQLRSEAEREAAATTAMRSLIIRGLVRAEAVTDPLRPGEPGPADEIAAALRGTLLARRCADHVLATERRTAEGLASSIYYVHDSTEGRRVLAEVFDAQGIHAFYLMEGATFLEHLMGFADPVQGIGDEDGEPDELPVADFADSPRTAALQQPLAVTSVALQTGAGTDPASFTLFALADRTELMEVDGEGDSAVVRLAPISGPSLSGLIDSLLEPEHGLVP